MHSRIERKNGFATHQRSGKLLALTAAGLLVLPLLHPGGPMAANGLAEQAKDGGKKETPDWMTADAGSKTVEFRIQAAASDVNERMNFNGHAKGDMTLVVPAGWHVKFTFSNNDPSVAHSMEIVDVQQSLPMTASATKPAFPGATMSSVGKGIVSGETASFEFDAKKPGKYWMICGVPGHAFQGMWDYFEVSSSESSPYVMLGGS